MNSHTLCAVGSIAAAFALVSTNATADDPGPLVSWSSGLEYSSGDYGGSDDIEDLYVPLTGRVDYQRISLELTVPYLSVRAPSGTTVTDPGGEPVPGSGEMSTESGLGDVIAGLTVYDVYYNGDLGVAMDLTGKVKFGTADEEKGLGTGEQDFTLRADVFKFFEQLTLLGSAGYKFRGDPSGVDLNNVFLGTIGGSYSLNETSRFGVMYDYRESALADSDAISELSAFVSRRVNENWQVQFYAFTGFSESSADWGAGILFYIG